MQLFTPFALKHGVLTIMSFKPQVQPLHQLHGMMMAAVAAHHQAMNVEISKRQIKQRRQRLADKTAPGIGRVN
ncbi:MAG: hypothetical protein MO846_02305 [Candidatus Devosia symbiotica]|nr:hypothetical protein [Candidatus Devosia symbiotica]